MDPTATLNTPATEAAEAQASIAQYLAEIDQLREQMRRDQDGIDRSQQRTRLLLDDLKAVLAQNSRKTEGALRLPPGEAPRGMKGVTGVKEVSLILGAAAVLVSSRDCAAQAPEVKPAPPPLSVSIAVPMDAAGDRSIPLHWSDPHFDVVIRNTSDQLQRVWAEDCSLGYDDLTLEVVAVDGKALPKPALVSRFGGMAWSANYIHGVILAPGDTIVREVRLQPRKSEGKQAAPGASGEGMRDMLHSAGFDYQNFPNARAVRMRAVFQIGDNDFARQSKIWTGLVTSDTGNYQVVDVYP